MTAKNTDPKNVILDPNSDILDFGAALGKDVEKKLKFKPRAELNGLCQGFLVGVSVGEIVISAMDSKGMPSTYEYAGFTLPTLKLSFRQKPTTADPYDRFYDHSITPFATVKNNGDAIARKDIMNHYQEEYKFLMHILNAFRTNANFVEPVIPATNFFGEVNERIASIKKYYEAWAKAFAGKDGKGFEKQLNNMKLIASQAGTYLQLPNFVGEGFIEKHVDGKVPSIEIKISESVTLVKKEAKSKAGAGASAGGPAASEQGGYGEDIESVLKSYRQG